MIRIRDVIFFAGAAWLPVSPALAEMPARMPDMPAESCTSPGVLPPELAGWGAAHKPVQAAGKRSELKAAALALGQAADTSLKPTPAVRYVVRPGKPGGSVSYGGMFAFDVAQEGNYRVAIDGHSWLEVVADKAALTSFAHGHGPACTGVAKMVDYRLKPGRHILEVSANGGPQLTVLVTRLP